MSTPDNRHFHWPYNNILEYRTLEGPRPVETPADWEIRRTQIERAVLSILGPFPVRRCPLEPRVVEERRHGGTIRRTVEYQVEPGDRVLADLAFPAEFDAPLPAVLALHGTNQCLGKDTLWEMPGYPDMETTRILPELGFAVLAPDGPVMRDRQPPGYEPGDTDWFYEIYPGWSIMGKYAFEASRAVDLIHTVDFVDASRIGVMGHSLGGYWSIFAAAFDERIATAVSSCGFVPFRWDSNPYDWNSPTRWARYKGFSHMPALAKYYEQDIPPPFDWHELIAMIAPRPFLNVSGWRDDCWPDAEGIPEVCALAERVWGLLGAPQGSFECFMYDGTHDQFQREKIHGWLVEKCGVRSEE